MRSISDAQHWVTIAEYGNAQAVSTLTTLLALTDYGSDYKALAVFLSNEDATDAITLIVDVSHGGTKVIDELTHTVSIAAGAEGYVFLGEPHPFTYIRIGAQTDSPGFPAATAKWALLGLPRH